jgi:hypothetical protein
MLRIASEDSRPDLAFTYRLGEDSRRESSNPIYIDVHRLIHLGFTSTLHLSLVYYLILQNYVLVDLKNVWFVVFRFSIILQVVLLAGRYCANHAG